MHTIYIAYYLSKDIIRQNLIDHATVDVETTNINRPFLETRFRTICINRKVVLSVFIGKLHSDLEHTINIFDTLEEEHHIPGKGRTELVTTWQCTAATVGVNPKD